MTTITLTKGVNEISTLIASIKSVAGQYKQTVSAALLSSVQHYREHGDYTLIQGALEEMYAVNYRDYKVCVAFLESMTWVGLSKAKDGRREKATVVGDLLSVMGEKPAETSVSDWQEKRKKVASNNITRQGIFDNFAQGKEVMVRNPEWTKEMDADKKTVGVLYQGNIFAWYDDVQYFRKAATTPSTGEATPVVWDDAMVLAEAVKVGNDLRKSSNVPVGKLIVNIIENIGAADMISLSAAEIQLINEKLNGLLPRATRLMEEAAARAAETSVNDADNAPATEQTA